MTPQQHLGYLARLQDAFATLAAAADPGAPIPGLGGWTVRELVLHLAGVHRWAGQMARGDDGADDDLPVDETLSATELAARYAEHAAALRATLTTVGPHGTAATLLGPGPASFWYRRQMHETLIHLGDLAAARAGAWTADALDGVVDLGPEPWRDGVDEVVTMFQPRQVRLRRMPPLVRHVALRDAETGTAWVLGAHEDGHGDGHEDGHDDRSDDGPAVTVTADARTLDLLLWGRVGPDTVGVVIDGDRDALDAALASALTP